MGKKRAKHRPVPVNCCQELADRLNVTRNHCFEVGPTSAGEAGIRAVFRYKPGARPGMCRIDLRCLLEEWDDSQCDFLFYRCADEEMHFVELKKTSDWKQAFNQIMNTIAHLSQGTEEEIECNKINAYVIHHNTPPSASQLKRDLAYKFKQLGYKKLEFVRSGTQIIID